MAVWENAIITNKGLALQAKLVSGNTLSLLRAVAGAGYVDPAELEYQTAVTDERQELTFATQSYPEEGKCAVPVRLSNSGISAEYTVNQIGIIAFDPDEGEILYMIAQATDRNLDGVPDGTDVPAEIDMPGFSAEWKFFLQYGQADGVSVAVDPSNTVNATDVDTMIEEHNTSSAPHANVLATKTELRRHETRNDNPHGVTKEQLGLGDVQNTPDSEKNVAFAREANLARQLRYSLIVHLNGGRTEGTDMWTYNGSTSRSINITPSKIGAAKEDHTHTPAEIGAVSMKTASVSLTTSGWSSKKQTVSVDGVTASNTVIVSPAPASFINYRDCGVRCSAQADGTLTFTCEDTPSAKLTVNVLILN